MQIRPYVETDWEQVREIYDLSKPDEMRGSVEPEAILPLSGDPAMLRLFRESAISVADDSGSVVGFGGHKGNYLSWLFVHPARRGQGIARALVLEILSQVDGPVTLNVATNNRPARNLYTQLVFVIVREFEGEFNGHTVPVLTLRHENTRPVAASRQMCVGALILNEQGQVFVQRRSRTRRVLPGVWDIVGGHVEAGESLEAALAREIAEETGWVLRRIGARIADWEWEHDGTIRRELDYLVEVDGDLAAPRLEVAKHDAHAWVGLATLDLMMEGRTDGDVQLRDVVAKALEIHASADTAG